MLSYFAVGMTLAFAQVPTTPAPDVPAPQYVQGAMTPVTRVLVAPCGSPVAPAPAAEPTDNSAAKVDPSSEAAKEAAGRCFLNGLIKANFDASQDKDWPQHEAEKKDKENGKESGNGSEAKEPKSGEDGFHDFLKPKRETGGFPFRLYKAYYDEFFPPPNQPEAPEQPRRALPAPFDAPPFPSSEYQGYPMIGIPAPDPGQYPIMKAI